MYIPERVQNVFIVRLSYIWTVLPGKRIDSGKGREGKGVLIVMHGRGCMTIDPRIPTNAGTEHVGFSPTRQTLLACTEREAKREVLGESHEG